MDPADAVALLRGAVAGRGGIWADLGAGSGTFTRALVTLLGPRSRVYAVDRDPAAMQSLAELSTAAVEVVPVTADFTAPLELPGHPEEPLDGILMANALHFVAEPATLLARLVSRVRGGGRLVLVEYDDRPANRWVPYPVSRARFASLARDAGLSAPVVLATRPSEYGGIIYCAAADRATDADPARQTGG